MAIFVGKKSGPTAFGLMGFTWRQTQTPDEQAFATMDRALELGANLWFGAEFYGTPEPTLNLQLIKRYFEARPENKDKVILNIKGGADIKRLVPAGKPEDVKASVRNCNAILGASKKIDIFSCARVDPETPIEETITALAELVRSGEIGGIGMSECSAATLERAAKVHQIANAEVEFSLWSPDILRNGVYETCLKHNIPVTAYSPLGRGFLTGQVRSPNDLPEHDMRRHLDRFNEENFDKNLARLHAVEAVAAKKGVSPTQLALAWTRSYPGVVPIPGATRVERVTENTEHVTITKAEKEELDNIVDTTPVHGGRYNERLAAMLEG